MQKAIEKINAEMQKNPTNEYMEIVGHYIIDRCTGSAQAAIAVNGGKSLSGAMEAIKAEAKKKAKDGCGVLRDNEIFDIIDKYLSAPADEQARAESIRAVDGDKAVNKKSAQINMDFESLFDM